MEKYNALEHAYSIGEKDFVGLILKAGLSYISTQRSLIIPTTEELANLGKISDVEKLKEEICVYILNSNISKDKIVEILSKKQDLKLAIAISSGRKYFDVIGSDSKITFNGVEIVEVKKLMYSTLYRAKGKLTHKVREALQREGTDLGKRDEESSDSDDEEEGENDNESEGEEEQEKERDMGAPRKPSHGHSHGRKDRRLEVLF